MLKVGDVVSIRVRGARRRDPPAVVLAMVTSVADSIQFVCATMDTRVPYKRAYHREGVFWARGWDTPEANALRAAAALAR